MVDIDTLFEKHFGASQAQTSDIDTVFSKHFSEERPTQQAIAEPTATPGGITLPKSSALSFLDRLQFSFAGTPQDQENFLRDRFDFVAPTDNGKFAAGSSPADLKPVDPPGIFGDVIGELADIAGFIPVIAGQIGGSIAGAPAGPAGIIAGGAAGAAGGQAATEFIGTRLGVNTQKINEQATDIAISGAFGALGEGLGLGLLKAGSALAPTVGKLISKGARSSEKAASIFPGLLKISSNVKPKATSIVIKEGWEKVFTPESKLESTLINMINIAQKQIKAHDETLGITVQRMAGELTRATRGNKVVDTTPFVNTLLKDLENLQLLGPGGVLNKNFTKAGSDFSNFTSLLKQVAKKVKVDDEIAFIPRIGQDAIISTKKAIGLNKQFGSTFDKLSDEGQFIMTRFLHAEPKDAAIKGVTATLDDVAAKFGIGDKYRIANAEFSSWRQTLSKLRSDAGLDVKNRGNWGSLIGAPGKPGSILNPNAVRDAELKALDAAIPFELLPNIERYAAAQEFTSAAPNLLRLGAVASLLGMSRFESPEEKLAFGLPTAILFGSPFGAKQLLRGRQAVVGVNKIRVPLPKSTEGLKRAGAALLSRILSSKFDPSSQSQ